MSRVDEIKEQAIAEAARVYGCDPEEVGHGTIVIMSRALLAEARVEKLEGLLTRMLESADENGSNFAEGSGPRTVWSLLSEARTLLADESKENEQ